MQALVVSSCRKYFHRCSFSVTNAIWYSIVQLHSYSFSSVVRDQEILLNNTGSLLGDKEGIARSDDLGRDLSSVQTLFTKQV